MNPNYITCTNNYIVEASNQHIGLFSKKQKEKGKQNNDLKAANPFHGVHQKLLFSPKLHKRRDYRLY